MTSLRDKIVESGLEENFTSKIVKVSSIESEIEIDYKVKNKDAKGLASIFNRHTKVREVIQFDQCATIETTSTFGANYKIKISVAYDKYNNIAYWKYKI